MRNWKHTSSWATFAERIVVSFNEELKASIFDISSSSLITRIL